MLETQSLCTLDDKEPSIFVVVCYETSPKQCHCSSPKTQNNNDNNKLIIIIWY